MTKWKKAARRHTHEAAIRKSHAEIARSRAAESAEHAGPPNAHSNADEEEVDAQENHEQPAGDQARAPASAPAASALAGVETFEGDEEDDDDNQQNQQKQKKKKSGGFQSMNLSSAVFQGVMKKGYRLPTPIQRKTIPRILAGHDLVAMARTGSGKTAAFLIPLFEKLRAHSTTVGVRAVILSPTRELALQTMQFFHELGRFTDLRACLLVGGEDMERQFAQLARNPDVLIATPGRLAHHLIEAGFSLKLVQYVVFDEADRLFEMGFEADVRELLTSLPESRQTLLFSATMPKNLAAFVRAGLRDPQVVRLDAEHTLSSQLQLCFLACRTEAKPAALLFLLRQVLPAEQQAVVFAATRHHVEFLALLCQLEQISVASVYGNMDQAARASAVSRFRKGSVRVLVVTDLAARGLDVPRLDNVINYDFPLRPKLFVHRAGRTARQHRSGLAISLVSADELPYMVDLHLFLSRGFRVAPEDQQPSVQAFPSEHSLYGGIPQSLLDADDEAVRERLASSADLQSLWGVLEKAAKAHWRSAPGASAESVARARALPPPPAHPALWPFLAPAPSSRAAASSASTSAADFVSLLRTFRPPQTAIEMVGKNAKTLGAASAANKLKQQKGSPAAAPGPADGTVMSVMRKKRAAHEHLIERQRKKRQAPSLDSFVPLASDDSEVVVSVNSGEDSDDNDNNNDDATTSGDVNGGDAVTLTDPDNLPSFVDREHFIAYQPPRHRAEKMFEMEKGSHQRLEELVLDLNPDERDKLRSGGGGGGGGNASAAADSSAKPRSRMQWDRKKKRFVRAAGDVNAVTGNRKRKLLNESGAPIAQRYKSDKYEQWTRKTHLRIPAAGEQELALPPLPTHRHRPGRYEPAQQHSQHSSRQSAGGPRRAELKNPEQLRKERLRKERLRDHMKPKSSRSNSNAKGKPKGKPKSKRGPGSVGAGVSSKKTKRLALKQKKRKH